MAVAIRIPAADPTTEEVSILRWLKQKGDPVQAGEPVVEIQTDKAAVEIESFSDGVLLEILAEPDQTVKVSAVIAIVGEPGEDVSDLCREAAG